MNLLARVGRGYCERTAQRLTALNAVTRLSPSPTLPDATPVADGEMVATIKIIPFALSGAALAHAEAACAGGAIGGAAVAGRRIGLVLSTLPGLKPSVIAGTIQATEGRVQSIAPRCCRPCSAAHRRSRLLPVCANCSPTVRTWLLVAGASAVVDRRDVGPAGIVAAGGRPAISACR